MSLFSRVKQPQGEQWLVVDKVRVPDIEELAYTYLPDLTLVSLFAGTPYEHLNEIGPVAIKYTAVTEFETMLINDFALRTSSVLFSAEQGVEHNRLIEHLQALHYVIKDDSPLFFRYYSSLIWEQSAAHLNRDDINTIVGPFHSMSWINGAKVSECIETERKEKINELPYQLTSDIFSELV